MNYELADLVEDGRTAIVSIFNHYVEHSFAAYPDEPVTDAFFDRILAMSKGYPAVSIKTGTGEVAGFGFLHAFHSAATFRLTAEIPYFLLPEHTGKGLGNHLLAHFIEKAREIGVDNLLASVSSLNEPSLLFHARAGFERCGSFRAVGRKLDREFDVVWFQKRL